MKTQDSDARDLFEREIRMAVTLELERFSMATAQHFASHADLVKISNFKVTDPANNYHQQSGFSAEIKQVARANAKNILAGKPTRVARTDDLKQVNHPIFDYVEVDAETGSAIKSADGGYVGGAQMKVHKNIETYREHFKGNFEKYKSAKLVLPSDQFDTIMSDWEAQQISLEQQVEALTKKGDTTLAAQKQDEINRIKDARGRAVKSEVSTSDAMEARKSPTLSVGKDVLRVAHKAGTEAGKNAAILGGGISTLRNGYAVLNGDKTIGDASLDVLADTGRAAIAAYASGVTTATVGGALQAANEQVLRNLGKGNTPAMIVQTSTFLAKGMVDVIRGKITPEQLVGQLTREGTTLAMSLTGSNLGAVIGTFIAPGVGTIVGGFVGGMVSSMLSGSMHSMLQQSVRALELSDEQRERTQAICARLVWQHQEYRRQMSVVFEQFFLEKRTELKSAFDSISEATMRGDSIRQGLEGVAQAFGKRLAFDSGAHIRSRLRSGQALDF
ncbi:TPA: hypothetical protein QDC51_005066 [Burkholderia multivorans]|uniref:hypothetical protein n=1 Tax=Burkholderia multivorans TaxID=87883 RepID=UPI001C22E881|nr:hypothetical protein [Burkholderia multivorans]MBU9349794.1 hypothetical protein [Burkholderia multivorans]MBU9394816.1 hypothetical protein [Burkholderia multivorans]HDR9838215.1 hypothetical protein [Burkholderia multivorans]HDR9844155.1 hypothetical protein [Burkholderia multivorans]HDR9850810.1 hypothetical protein [Burkholderia multivorans]